MLANGLQWQITKVESSWIQLCMKGKESDLYGHKYCFQSFQIAVHTLD